MVSGNGSPKFWKKKILIARSTQTSMELTISNKMPDPEVSKKALYWYTYKIIYCILLNKYWLSMDAKKMFNNLKIHPRNLSANVQMK